MTITLTPRWASSSLQLDGKSYIDCDQPSFMPGLNNFTLEAWINTSDITNYQPIVSNANYITDRPWGQFEFGLYEGYVRAYAGLKNGSYTTLSSVQPLAINTWHHIAVVFTYSSTSSSFLLYVDGIQVDQQTNQGALVGTYYNLLIGGSQVNSAPGYFFQGQIGRVMIWNTARDAGDILDDSMQVSVYNAIEAPGLVFYTDFSVLPAVDSSGSNISLAFKNNAQYAYNVPAVVLGSTGYVNCGSYAGYSIPGNKPYTIEGWFSPNSASAGTLISYGTNGAWEYEVLYQNNQVIGKRNSDSLQIVSQNAVAPNSYYHFALTYDDSTKVLSLYVNSNLQAVAYFPSLVTAVPNGTVLLGAQFDSNGNPSSFFNGAIQDIRIWNVCLEQAEIYQWLYNDVVDDSRLIAHFDFTVNPPVDAAGQARITLCNNAKATLQNISIAPGDAVAQLGVPQPINAVYLNQNKESSAPPPGQAVLAPQPALFSDAHREAGWQQLIESLHLQEDEGARSNLRTKFEAAYEQARQMAADNPQLLKGCTRTNEKGLTRVVYHGVKGDVLIYEAPIGADSDCTIWWISYIYTMTVALFQALGLVPSNLDIANKIYNYLSQSETVMKAFQSLIGTAVTVNGAIAVLKVIYDQGMMWPLLKFIFISVGWQALYWILTRLTMILTGGESIDALARAIVWAGQVAVVVATYDGSCSGQQNNQLPATRRASKDL